MGAIGHGVYYRAMKQDIFDVSVMHQERVNNGFQFVQLEDLNLLSTCLQSS